MKTTLPLVFALLLAVLVAGCARERNHTKAANPRRVAFSKAGVSLVLGNEWQWVDTEAPHTLRPPTLVSSAGRIRVLLLPPDRAEPGIVADGLRTSFDADPQVAKHSFRRQQLVSTNGLRIVCVSYVQQAEQNGELREMQNRHYLIKNRSGRCVAIDYLAQAGSDAESVHRMIQQSLTLQ